MIINLHGNKGILPDEFREVIGSDAFINFYESWKMLLGLYLYRAREDGSLYFGGKLFFVDWISLFLGLEGLC